MHSLDLSLPSIRGAMHADPIAQTFLRADRRSSRVAERKSRITNDGTFSLSDEGEPGIRATPQTSPRERRGKWSSPYACPLLSCPGIILT